VTDTEHAGDGPCMSMCVSVWSARRVLVQLGGQARAGRSVAATHRDGPERPYVPVRVCSSAWQFLSLMNAAPTVECTTA
jgi:hypothetical protein